MNYICVSGGADSTAMVLLAWERGENFEMLFSDTGAELPENYWLLPRLAEKVGEKLNVCSNGGFFEHLVRRNYFLPGPRIRWCTKELKMIPQDYFAMKNGIREMAVGIRADEPRRIRTERASYAHFDAYYPLVEAGYGKKEVKEICAKHGLLNPVYEWRSNVSCFCCFFQKKRDWKGLLINHPSFYAIAQEWERQSVLTSPNKYLWNENWSLEDFKKAKDSQAEMWPEPDAEPCLICSV
jgi:3'-phosphoadenosine 5'-phosphosulfate sulfotransferase (PAPS reductase)/FAD synthetase